MSRFLVGWLSFWAGVALMSLFFWVFTVHGTANTCRAANPGYDCTLGWVKGEAFK